MKHTNCIILCLLLSACGGNEIENAVKNDLRDPDSAMFRNQTIRNDLNLACVEWKAKNGFGGYGGWTVADLKKVDGKWTLFDIEGSRQFSCDEQYLKNRADYLARQERGDAAHTAAKEEAVRLLATARNLTLEDAEKLISDDPYCQEQIKTYSYDARAIATDYVADMAKKLTDAGLKLPEGDAGRSLANPPSKKNEKRMKEVREKLKAGVCE